MGVDNRILCDSKLLYIGASNRKIIQPKINRKIWPVIGLNAR